MDGDFWARFPMLSFRGEVQRRNGYYSLPHAPPIHRSLDSSVQVYLAVHPLDCNSNLRTTRPRNIMINPDMFMVISECWITNVRLENYRLILLAHSHFTCIFPRDGRNSRCSSGHVGGQSAFVRSCCRMHRLLESCARSCILGPRPTSSCTIS